MDNRTSKLDTAFVGHPKPLFSLSATELWERFSFYGVRALLVLYMSAAMVDGGLGIDRGQASAIVGIFSGCLYLAALPGGYLADNLLGQRNATLIGASLIALGHLSIALSVFSTFMFFLGLVLIVLGTGLFKTCASIMVGLLYKKGDPRRDSGFTIFYMGINIGAFIAPIVCGTMKEEYGWHWGLGIGGVGMLISLLIFYFKTIPDFNEFDREVGVDKSWVGPKETNRWILPVVFVCLGALVAAIILVATGTLSFDAIMVSKSMVLIIGLCALAYFLYLLFLTNLDSADRSKLLVFVVLFCSSAIFWSTFEQQPTAFNLFTESYVNRMVGSFEIPVAWFLSINAIFIVVLAPVVGYIWIALSNRNMDLSSVTKFALGAIFAAACFGLMIFASYEIIDNPGVLISPMWLVVAYFLLTIGELALSPVGLSLMTQLAPSAIKGQVMGLWFVSISLGSVVAGLFGGEVKEDDPSTLPSLFGTSVVMLLVIAAILLVLKPKLNKLLTGNKS